MKELQRREFMKLGLGVAVAAGTLEGPGRGTADAQTAAAQRPAARIRSICKNSLFCFAVHWHVHPSRLLRCS